MEISIEQEVRAYSGYYDTRIQPDQEGSYPSGSFGLTPVHMTLPGYDSSIGGSDDTLATFVVPGVNRAFPRSVGLLQPNFKPPTRSVCPLAV